MTRDIALAAALSLIVIGVGGCQPSVSRQAKAFCWRKTIEAVAGADGYDGTVAWTWNEQTRSLAADLKLVTGSEGQTVIGTVHTQCVFPPTDFDPLVVEIDGHRVAPGESYDIASRRWTTAAAKKASGS